MLVGCLGRCVCQPSEALGPALPKILSNTCSRAQLLRLVHHGSKDGSNNGTGMPPGSCRNACWLQAPAARLLSDVSDTEVTQPLQCWGDLRAPSVSAFTAGVWDVLPGHLRCTYLTTENFFATRVRGGNLVNPSCQAFQAC